MGMIPLTSILSHKGRGGNFHLSVALRWSMITRNDIGENRRTLDPLSLPALIVGRRLSRAALGSLFLLLKVGYDVFAEEAYGVHYLLVGGTSGLEYGHNLVHSHRLEILDYANACVRVPYAVAATGQ